MARQPQQHPQGVPPVFDLCDKNQGPDTATEEDSAGAATHLVAGVRSGGGGRGKRMAKSYKALTFNPLAVYPGLSSKFNPRSEQIRVQMRFGITAFATTSTVANTAQAAVFTLNSVDQYASFTNLFDQYKIELVEAWIIPSVTTATSGTPEVGTYITAVDLDDDTVGSYLRSQIIPGNLETSVMSAHYHRWEPSVAVAAYSGAFTSYAAQSNQWVDCSSPAVRHYGLKWNATTTTTAVAFSAVFRMTVSFRGISTVTP